MRKVWLDHVCCWKYCVAQLTNRINLLKSRDPSKNFEHVRFLPRMLQKTSCVRTCLFKPKGTIHIYMRTWLIHYCDRWRIVSLIAPFLYLICLDKMEEKYNTKRENFNDIFINIDMCMFIQIKTRYLGWAVPSCSVLRYRRIRGIGYLWSIRGIDDMGIKLQHFGNHKKLLYYVYFLIPYMLESC